METHDLRNVLKFLQRQALRQGTGLPDSDLLERFVHSRDEAAFELLLWRHGPLVLNVCRRLLRNEHDVDDAFQATFAALACKAKHIRKQDWAAPWLYKVAYRAALAARVRSSRFVSLLPEAEPTAPTDDDLHSRNLRPVLDAEVQKLGEKYRSAFVLCYLQGLTHGEAATRLGCPEGTIHSRLATAKEQLRRGLERRGVTLSGTGIAPEFATRQIGAPPALHLVQHTLTAAFSMAGNPLGGTVAKSSVVSLTKGVLFTMWMQSYTAPALVTLVLSLVGVGIVGFQGKAGTKAADEPAAEMLAQRGGKTGKAAPDQPAQAKAEPNLDRQKELELMERQYTQAKLGAMSEQEHDRQTYEAVRHKLTAELLEKEETLRRLEQSIAFEREKEKKVLGALDQEQLEFEKNQRDRSLGRAKPYEGEQNRKEQEFLEAFRRLVKQKYEEVAEKEEQRSIALINNRLNVDEAKQRLKSEEDKWMRTSSTLDSQMARLESSSRAISDAQFALQSPQIANLLRTNPEETRALRLENKLDQVMRELAEMKKLLAKP